MKKSKRHFTMTTMMIVLINKPPRLRKTGGIFISVEN